MNISFTDMDDLDSNPAEEIKERVAALLPRDIASSGATSRAAAAAEMHDEICKKCGGSGFYRAPSSYGRQCFACNGKGVKRFKTSAEQRAKARESARARKQATLASNLEKFEQAHPDIAAWWKDSQFEFAISLRMSVIKYGDLTERQIGAARSCIAKLAASKAEKKAAKANAPVVDISSIKTSLERAKSNGIKRPKILLAGADTQLVFSLAADNSRNPGAVYVKTKEYGAYIGKIDGGKFHKGRDCSPALEAGVIEVCADPAQAAIAYGKRYGVCSCCGRELSNPESIERGIGPICAGKYFG